MVSNSAPGFPVCSGFTKSFTTMKKCLESPSSDYIRLFNRKHMPRTILICCALLVISPVAAQVKTVAEYTEQVRTLASRADLKAANDYIDRNHAEILREWIAITEINSPSGHEQERAKYIEGLLRTYQLDDVHYDSAGNLIA